MKNVNLFVQMVTLVSLFSMNSGMLYGNTIDSLDNDNTKKYEDSVEFSNGDYYRIYSINGIKYEECRVTYPSGNIYEGFCKDGIWNGYGKFTSNDGRSFEGEFVNGVLDKGDILLSQGNAYINYIKNMNFEEELSDDESNDEY